MHNPSSIIMEAEAVSKAVSKAPTQPPSIFAYTISAQPTMVIALLSVIRMSRLKTEL